MKPVFVVILLLCSLGANCWLLAERRSAPLPASTPATSLPPPSTRPSSPTNAPARRPRDGATPPAQPTTESNLAAAPSFHWSSVESTDFREYIARLRAIGCPERLIRGLVSSEVHKLYAPKLAALRPSRAQIPYWEQEWNDPEKQMTPAQREQTRALEKEEKALLRSLLGEYFEDEGQMAYLGGDELWPNRLSAEQRRQLRAILQEFQEKEQDLFRAYVGSIGPDEGKELNQLKRQRRQALAAILSPTELEEYELRRSDLSNSLRHELRNFQATEAEFRAIFRSRSSADYGGDASFNDAPADQAMQAKQAELKAAAEAALAKELTPERFREYQLHNDHSYRALLDWGLSAESVQRMAQLKDSSERAVRDLQTNQNLTPEQKQQAAAAIRTATVAEVRTLLDDRHAQAYFSQGGDWVRDLAPRPQPAPAP